MLDKVKEKQWEHYSEYIEKTFEFENFKLALDFVNKVGEIAEEMNHHPNINLHDYKFVTIITSTHSENKVTEKDIELVSKIEKL